jgi:hypothetical protein
LSQSASAYAPGAKLVLPVRYLNALARRCRCLQRSERGASARLVLSYASRERKVQRVVLEPAVAHTSAGWRLSMPMQVLPL